MGIRQAAALLFILTRLTWTGLVVYTCSRAVSQMTGWPLAMVIIAVGLITISYTTMGGIRAVMVTDVTQASILFGGALMVIVFAMWSAQSFTGWWPNFHDPVVNTGLAWPDVKWFSIDPTDRITMSGIIFMYFVWWVATAGSDQLAIQRYLSTRDAGTARHSFLVSAISNAMVGGVLALSGVALLGFFLNNTQLIPPIGELLQNKPALLQDAMARMPSLNPEQQQIFTLRMGGGEVFPWFIARVLPAGLSGVLVAALLAAAMSSVSSGVNSISTVLMVDFQGLISRNLDERRKVRRAKIIGITVGLTAIAISFLLNLVTGNFMEIAQKVNGFFIAPLAALFLMAFFVKRVNKQGAWVAIFVGFIIGVIVSYYGELSKAITGTEVRVSFMYILPLSLIGSITAAYLVSLFFPPPEATDFSCKKPDNALT